MRSFYLHLSPVGARQRAQGTVEYGLVLAGGALLALLSYTLFQPIVTAAANQVTALLPSFR
jgi:hypothetical protein